MVSLIYMITYSIINYCENVTSLKKKKKNFKEVVENKFNREKPCVSFIN